MSRTGVSNVRPAAHIWPGWDFYFDEHANHMQRQTGSIPLCERRKGEGQTFQNRKCIGRDGEPDLNASASGKSEEMSEWFVTSATTVGIHGLGRMSLQTLFTYGS